MTAAGAIPQDHARTTRPGRDDAAGAPQGGVPRGRGAVGGGTGHQRVLVRPAPRRPHHPVRPDRPGATGVRAVARRPAQPGDRRPGIRAHRPGVLLAALRPGPPRTTGGVGPTGHPPGQPTRPARIGPRGRTERRGMADRIRQTRSDRHCGRQQGLCLGHRPATFQRAFRQFPGRPPAPQRRAGPRRVGRHRPPQRQHAPTRDRPGQRGGAGHRGWGRRTTGPPGLGDRPLVEPRGRRPPGG